MADARVPMTSKGYQFLLDELKRLKTVERPKNIREIEEARGHGDLSENAEFHAAKERQSLLDLQIREIEDKVAVMGLANKGPAQRAGLRTGDIVLAVADNEVDDLASLFRRIWSLGQAGVDVPLTLHREGDTFEVTVTSADRNRFLKAPRLH